MTLVILINLPQTLSCCSRSNQELKNLENFWKNLFWIRIGQLSFRNGFFLQRGRPMLDPWVGKIPWRRAWQPIPVFLLENPMDRGAWWATVHAVSESDTTERPSTAWHSNSFYRVYSGSQNETAKPGQISEYVRMDWVSVCRALKAPLN